MILKVQAEMVWQVSGRAQDSPAAVLWQPACSEVYNTDSVKQDSTKQILLCLILKLQFPHLLNLPYLAARSLAYKFTTAGDIILQVAEEISGRCRMLARSNNDAITLNHVRDTKTVVWVNPMSHLMVLQTNRKPSMFTPHSNECVAAACCK